MPRLRWTTARVLKLILLISFGLPLLLYAIITTRFYAGSPNITRNYMQEINDALPTEGEPAWPGLIDAWATFYAAPQEIRNKIWGNDAFIPAEHPDVVDWLAAHPEHVPTIRAAAHQPRLGLRFTDVTDPAYARASMPNHVPEEPSANPMLWKILLPHLSVVRQHARTLAAHAHIAAEADRLDEAIADVRAILALAGHAADPPFYISQRVLAGVATLAADTATRLIDEHADRFTPTQLDELDRALASLDPARLVLDLESEHMGFDDMLQRVYTDDGRGSGRLTPEGIRLLAEMECMRPKVIPAWAQTPLTAQLFAATYPSRRTMSETYHAHLDAARHRAATPLWQWEPMPELPDPAEAPWNERVLLVWLPAFSNVGIDTERARMLLEGARTAIALERFRRTHGHYPAILAELVPDFLDTLPIDRATGDPLVYHLNNGAPTLYSVGLNYTDNGGNHTHLSWRRWLPREELARRLQMTPVPDNLPTGDWVFYPPPPPSNATGN